MAPSYYQNRTSTKRNRSPPAFTGVKKKQKREINTAPSKPQNTSEVVENAFEKHVAPRTTRRRKEIKSNTTHSTAQGGNISTTSTVTQRYATIMDLPDELTLMVFEHCDKTTQKLLSETCKDMHRLGTEAIFCDFWITMGRPRSDAANAQFTTVLEKLCFTQHLRITTGLVDLERAQFTLLIKRLEELSLLSLHFPYGIYSIGAGPFVQFRDLLNSKERGQKLRSRLSNLDELLFKLNKLGW